MNNRDQQIDALRGFAILLVVLGHCIQFSGIDFDNNFLFRLIYSFHMPLFMFISGYVSFFSTWKGFATFKNKFFLLLVPFFSWGLISFFKLVILNKIGFYGVFDFFFHLVLYPDNEGLWFLWVLFLINLLIFFVRSTRINLEVGLAFFFFLINFAFLRWPQIGVFGLGLLKYHLFYFLLGLFYCRTRDRYKHFYNILIYSSFIPFLVMSLFWFRLHPPLFIINLNLSIIFTKLSWLCYQYFSAVMGIASAICLIKIIYRFSYCTTDILKNFGVITLEIYALHFYIFSLWFYIFDYMRPTPKITSVFFATLLSTILMIILMKKSPIISFLFFGQKKRYVK